jgi:FkbM family methyltransferase
MLNPHLEGCGLHQIKRTGHLIPGRPSRSSPHMSHTYQFLMARLAYCIIALVPPYVVREFPGWGYLLRLFCGYERDWLWAAAPTKKIRNKLTGQIMALDLANWSDRLTFFLGRWYDLETQLFTSSIVKPGDTVIDIGANRGMFALFASSIVGATGAVICFEPNPQCVAVLDRDVRLNGINNVAIHNIGLGDREQELILTIPSINSGEGTFGTSPYDEKQLYRTRVPVKRGDDVLCLVSPVMIKVDTEGFEPRVLAGLENTIKRTRPVIVTEIAPNHLKSCGSSVRELLALMERYGYQGLKLELVKKHGKHRLALNRSWGQDEDCDVAWIPTSAVGHYLHLLGLP